MIEKNNNPVYISYAWANANNPDLEDEVNRLCRLMDRNGIYYKRDKENLCPYRWSINKAEEEIGEGCAVVVVISEKYIKSLHCMHEWHLIKENGKIWQRVFPIVLKGADLTDKNKYKEYYKFFTDRRDELVEQLREGIIPLSQSETEAARFGYYISDLAEMYQYLTDYNTAKSVVRENDYDLVISQLKKHLEMFEPQNQESKPKPKPDPKKESKPEPKKEDTRKKGDSVYDGLTKKQTSLLQKNINSTYNAFLEDEKNGNNGYAAKEFLKKVTKPLRTDGVYDEETKNVVMELQHYLNRKQVGWFEESLELDGIYGPKTEDAYDKWSKKANPNVDKKILDK
ncbi:MAG: TIR domain-containing protein [Bacteroidales bacterium]|nr:TIR domain-containing protein [Bacteroidales bacterium]